MITQDHIHSIYIHIPFCKNICSYCDFCKFYYHQDSVSRYLKALSLEIHKNYKNEVVDTIYIGGGTPSSLSILELNELFVMLDSISVSSKLEFTVECNIQDLTEEMLILFLKHRVNRLSIGIQSFDTNILSFLDRNISLDQILANLTLAKKYFSNINIDLIYAVPGQTLEVLEKELETFLSLQIPHISTYSLMIEPHTKLGIQKIMPISEELDSKMYELIHTTLTKHGYQHYEISNYALPGYESEHNLTYWKNEKYYGFGLGASGYIGNIRYTNTKNFNQYLSGNFISETEIMNPILIASNQAILGLRTIYGVSKKKWKEISDSSFVEYFSVSDLVDEHILIETEDSYFIHPKYWYVLNEILVKFV